MWKTIGHSDVCSYLQERIEKRELHHAYLFVGEHHLGKRHVAVMFAKTVLDIPLDQEQHPDLILFSEEKNEVSVKSVRQLIGQASRKPYSANHSVIIIENAQKLNRESSNAILKTLEEPPKHLIIILIAEQANQLLGTIRSRCATISFHRVPESEFAKHDIDKRRVRDAHGKPGMLFDTKKIERQQNARTYFESIEQAPFVKQSTIAKELGKDRNESIQYCEEWLDILHEQLHGTVDRGGNKHSFQAPLIKLLETIEILKRTNANTQLTLESFFLTLTEAKRSSEHSIS